mmetsp:Transcript_26617/g.48944  ORF Transcript_26617/g.48944 Transcript_26617/m.48944 type:complete len:200 (-) Transcript_26617:1510-2109(-)
MFCCPPLSPMPASPSTKPPTLKNLEDAASEIKKPCPSDAFDDRSCSSCSHSTAAPSFRRRRLRCLLWCCCLRRDLEYSKAASSVARGALTLRMGGGASESKVLARRVSVGGGIMVVVALAVALPLAAVEFSMEIPEIFSKKELLGAIAGGGDTIDGPATPSFSNKTPLATPLVMAPFPCAAASSSSAAAASIKSCFFCS